MTGCRFSVEECVSFLHFVRETRTFKDIDGRSATNISIFRNLCSLTNERHQTNKTPEQWRTKWKKMKSTYLAEKTKASKSGVYKLINLKLMQAMLKNKVVLPDFSLTHSLNE